MWVFDRRTGIGDSAVKASEYLLEGIIVSLAVAAGNSVEISAFRFPAVAPELHSGREPAVGRCR